MEAVDRVTLSVDDQLAGDVHELLAAAGALRGIAVQLLTGDDVTAGEQRRDRRLQEVERGGAVVAREGEPRRPPRLEELDAQPVGGGDGGAVDLGPGHRHLVVEEFDVGCAEVVHAPEDADAALREGEGGLVADVDERPQPRLGHGQPEVVGVDRPRIPGLAGGGEGKDQVRLRRVNGDRHGHPPLSSLREPLPTGTGVSWRSAPPFSAARAAPLTAGAVTAACRRPGSSATRRASPPPFRLRITTRAASCPGTPQIPPVGWVPAPLRKRPGTGVA